MAHFRGGLWNPPPDPEKPPCPYTLGFTVNIMQHKPRAPFGGREYGRADWPYDPSREWLQSVTQTKHVLQHPPPDSNPTPSGSSTPQIARLVITDLIAVEDGRGAQIAVCSITPQAVEADCKPYMAVAKIFDPLYYSFRNQIARHRPSDVVFDAETDYCREAAAYEHLQKTGQTGLFAPEYHGSWTFNLPICYEGVTQQRPVRLLLIEHLNGVCIARPVRGPTYRDVRHRIPSRRPFQDARRLYTAASQRPHPTRLGASKHHPRPRLPRHT